MDLKIFILIIFSIIGIRFVFNKGGKVNLLDVLIISSVLFFGFYPIIDVLKQNYLATIGVFIITISYIILTLVFLLIAFNLLMPAKQKRTLRFSSYIQKVLLIPQNIVIVLFLIASGIIMYFFLKYGLIFRVINEDLAIVNTYKQIILSIVFPLFSLVTISSISRILIVKNKKTNFFNFLFLGLITSYWLFYGRRELIFHILIMGLVWFVSTNGVISRKIIINGLLGICLIIIGSNVYQNLRSDLMIYSISKEINITKSVWEMAFDFKSSNQNFDERSSALPLLSKIIDEISLNEDLSSGELFLTSLSNVTPSVLVANKTFIDEDFIIARQLRIAYTDFNTTLFSGFYIDFGLFSVFLLPFFLFMYYIFVSVVLVYLKNSSIIFILVYSEALSVSLNMEAGISSVLGSIRIILILAFLYFLLNKIVKLFFKIEL
tara:strand:- start:10782 stop:12083 length:1302 start_codon:yes stop_codon:yes gene_type:complete